MASQPPQTNQVTYVTQTGYVNVPPSNDGVKKYADVFMKLGITQLVLGVLSIVFGIAILAYAVKYEYYYDWEYFYSDSYAFISTGIWAGIFFLVSGILGVLTGKKMTRCLNVAALVMTIFSALAAATLLGFEITGAVYGASNYYLRSQKNWMVSCGIHSTLSVIGFAEFVVSIVHSAYCCGAHCCQTSAQQTRQPVTYTYVNPAQQIPVTQLPPQPTTYVHSPFMQPQPGQFIITSNVPQPGNNLQIHQQPGHFPQSQLAQHPPAYSGEKNHNFHS